MTRAAPGVPPSGVEDDRPDPAKVRNAWRDRSEVPARTPLSDAISRDLKRRGFGFVGSTIVYAHMKVDPACSGSGGPHRRGFPGDSA